MLYLHQKRVNFSRYVEYLKREIDILAKHIDRNREVIQFHFGVELQPTIRLLS